MCFSWTGWLYSGRYWEERIFFKERISTPFDRKISYAASRSLYGNNLPPSAKCHLVPRKESSDRTASACIAGSLDCRGNYLFVALMRAVDAIVILSTGRYEVQQAITPRKTKQMHANALLTRRERIQCTVTQLVMYRTFVLLVS